MSLFTSTLVQGLAIAGLVVAPLLAMQSLPEPRSRWSMPAYVPVVPAPPRMSVPRPRPTRAVSRTPAKAPSPGDVFHVPVDVPTGILDEPDFAAGDEAYGIPGGVPDSVGAPLTREPVAETPSTPRQPLRSGIEIREPRKIHHVSPVYPRIALEARLQGTVVLETVIDVDGSVTDLRVIRSQPLLDAAAIEAVRQWKYEPTRLNGVPVPVLLTVEVVFRLSS